MDDFFPEMQPYFPNMFAEALIPVNPIRLPAYVAGSAMSSDMPEFSDKIKTPFENLIVAKEYLETSQSDIQWRDRFWQLTEDTMKINMASEVGKEPGSFAAGALSNKIADKYMTEMVETLLSLNDQEKLNCAIFKQTAKNLNIDPDCVRGTGFAREFVPEYMKGDICDRPVRNARPFDNDNHYSGKGLVEDGIIFNSKNNDPSGNSIFESSSSPVENQKSFLSRFFDLFGGGSDNNMCPVNTEYAYDESPLMDKLFGMFGFFIPENGGAYCVNDPSMMVPSSPFIADLGDSYLDS